MVWGGDPAMKVTFILLQGRHPAATKGVGVRSCHG